MVAQGDSNGGGGGGNKATLVVKTNRWTDQERYLDATQRCVLHGLFTSRTFFACFSRDVFAFCFLLTHVCAFCEGE